MKMPQVKVTEGLIKGEKRTAFDGNEYYGFEGIPYAKPPVGKLRFHDPQAPDSWTGVKDCTKPGNRCAQINPFGKGFEGSEDCLYLNVYTPSLPAEKIEKLPVLFFIHGGRLTFGYGDYYQPDYYIRHDVILVTFNYSSDLTEPESKLRYISGLDTPEVPGNAGLKDSAAALKWVRKNIQSFNGDCNNITVFGESGGAGIGTTFLCSKQTIGLFSKLIAQSGNTLADVFIHIEDHIAVAKKVAANLGKNVKNKQELYEFFQEIPVDKLIGGYTATKNDRLLMPLLGVVVEKEFAGTERFIHEHPVITFRSGRFYSVPMLLGSNMYEGAAFVHADKLGKVRYIEDFTKFVPNYLYLNKNDRLCIKIADGINKHFFKGKKVSDDTRIDYIRMFSGALFERDITKFSEEVCKNNNNIYSYKFSFVGNLNIGIMKSLNVHGTTHGDAIQYQFYRKKQAGKVTRRDQDMVDFFSEVFTNFAKNGKPTWSRQECEWLPYTPRDKLTLIIDDSKRLVRNPDWENFEFWNKLCGDRAKL